MHLYTNNNNNNTQTYEDGQKNLSYAIADCDSSFYDYYDAIMDFTVLIFNIGLQAMPHTCDTSNSMYA